MGETDYAKIEKIYSTENTEFITGLKINAKDIDKITTESEYEKNKMKIFHCGFYCASVNMNGMYYEASVRYGKVRTDFTSYIFLLTVNRLLQVTRHQRRVIPDTLG